MNDNSPLSQSELEIVPQISKTDYKIALLLVYRYEKQQRDSMARELEKMAAVPISG